MIIAKNPVAQQYDILQKMSNWDMTNKEAEIKLLRKMAALLSSANSNVMIFDAEAVDIYTGHKKGIYADESLAYVERHIKRREQ